MGIIILFRILHLDTEKTWRGGENQLRLLILGLNENGIKSFLGTVPGSELEKRLVSSVETVGIKKGGYHVPVALRLAYFVRKHDINIIDAHTSSTHSLGLIVKSLVPHVKLVVHRRVDNPVKKNLLTRWKYLSKGVDQYVAISATIARILSDYGVDERKIAVVKSATEMPRFSPSEKREAKDKIAAELGIESSCLFVGNASALDEQKDPLTLIEAFALFKKQTNRRAYLLLAGEGNLRSQVERKIHQLNLEGDVRLLGFRKDVRKFLLALELVVLPSVNEGLGTTLLDSLLCGCGVVASQVGGIPEIIIHEETGLLVPPKDPQGFAECILRLANDNRLREKTIAQGCSHVQATFSVRSMVHGNMEIYQRLAHRILLR